MIKEEIIKKYKARWSSAVCGDTNLEGGLEVDAEEFAQEILNLIKSNLPDMSEKYPCSGCHFFHKNPQGIEKCNKPEHCAPYDRWFAVQAYQSKLKGLLGEC